MQKKNCREQLSLRPQLSWRRHVPVIFMAWEKKPWSFNICTPKVFAVSWLHYFHVSSFKMLCTEKVGKRWGYRLVHLSWKTMHFSSCLDKLAEHSKYRQVQPFVLISLHSSWKSFKKSHFNIYVSCSPFLTLKTAVCLHLWCEFQLFIYIKERVSADCLHY